MTNEASSPLSRDFGTKVRARRKAIGMTQSELAFAVGVNRRVIGRLERGIGTVRVDTALKALRALGIELELKARGE
jgi:transcriptional regulator with XRE-family HTH domain